MATREFYTDISLERVSQLKDFRIHNVTTTEMQTMASALGIANEGLHVWNTTEKKSYTWDGAKFVDDRAEISGAMVFKGQHTSLTTEPANPIVGDVYIFTGSAGTLTWADVTFFPDAEIESGDQLIYRGNSIWDIIQGDLDYASEIEAGIIRLATQGEVNNGTVNNEAVTPATLNGYRISKTLASTFFANGINTTALTPLTINHGLNLQNKDSYVISIKNSASSEIVLDIDSIDANSLTITSAVALSNLKVTIIGF